MIINKRIDLLNVMLFLASPFLAIPSIFYGVIQKSKFSLGLLIMTFGLTSYYYIPNFSDDKARYFEIYEDFQGATFLDMFSFFFLSSQDFILQSLFYVASQMQIPAQLIFALVTIITLSLIFKIYYKIYDRFEKIEKKHALISLILLIFSLSYLDLFSGTRFMFATSFLVYSFYAGLIEKKKKLAIILLLVACFIHFSTVTFVAIYLMLLIYPKHSNLYKTIFFISMIFLLLPKDILFNLVSSLGFSGALEAKSKVYLNENDFIESGLETGTFGSFVIYYVGLLWIFASYIYLIITMKNKSLFRNIVLLLGAAINLFYAVPTVFFRYALIYKLLFTFLLIWELYREKRFKIVYTFIALFFMGNITQIIVTRNNIEKSFINADNFFLLNIFTKPEITPNDFIY